MSIAVTARPSPYKGLAPFEDSDLDALLFFGREVESEVIAANLMAARMTVLYGPSGVGKSSILRAGVAHRLRLEQGIEVVVFSTWTGDPVSALIDAVGGSGDSLVDAVEESAARAGGDLCLILDQFEEYFLYHPPGGPFATELAEIVRRPGLRVNVLLGMREDALARLDALKATIPNLLGNRLRLERLDADAGRAAILGPIERYNTLVAPEDPVAIEPELVDDVLHEVTVGRVELSVAGRGQAAGVDENLIEAPFLQLVLARLWHLEAERGSRTLRRETLGELGGAQRIVENHLERAMAELSPQEKGAAAAMYHFLVTPSGTKIAHGVRDLAGYASVDEDEAAGVLQRLTSERIVRASSENGPSTTRYEIFHDVLADAVLAWRSRFEADRRLEEQRRAHERRQRRLLAIGAGALLGLAVMAAVAVYALAQRSNAQHQAARAKAEQAKTESALVDAKKARRDTRKALSKAQAKERSEARAVKKERAATARATDLARAEKRERLLAQEAKGKETAAADYARGQTRLAQSQTRLAERETAKANRATAQANLQTRRVIEQKKLIGARALAASAEALLETDPENSVKTSLKARAAYRAAGRAGGLALETTLRSGLLGLRLKAVLPGGGPVQVVAYSPDAAHILVAGKGGARLFDRAHGLRLERLLPAKPLLAAAFGPDGRLVAGAGAVGTVQVWDAQTHRQLYELHVGGAVLSVAFSRDGRLLAAASRDGTATVWTLSDGDPVASFVHPKSVTSGIDDVRFVEFSPDSSRLLTVATDRFARVWDVGRGELAFRVDHGSQVQAARFSHDGKLIATAGVNEFLRLWNAANGSALFSLTPTVGRINNLVFSPDDTHIATGSRNDTSARVWSLELKTVVAVVTTHLSGVESVAFRPDGRMLVTTGRDGNAFITRTTSGFVHAALRGHGRAVNSAAFSPDGATLVTGSDDGTARVWDAEVDPIGPLPLAKERKVGKHALTVNAVAISDDGRFYLSAGDDRTARLWGPRGEVARLEHAGAVTAASFSANSRRVITGSDDGTARIWSVDGNPIATLERRVPITAVELSRDGRLAVVADRGGSAWLWRFGSGTKIELKHGAAIADARFSRDERFVVTAGADRTAVVWRVATGKRVAVLSGHTAAVVAATFSPDGKAVATASADQTARIWDARTGSSMLTLAGHEDELTSVAFSRDGRWLATASKDTDARIWDVRSGTPVAVLSFHQGPVKDVAFSHDGRWVATAGPTAVGLWQTRKQGRWHDRPIYVVRGATTPVNDVAFSARRWRIVFGSGDGSVLTYNCELCGGLRQLSAIARSRLNAIHRVKP
jgi:WD40 repeat protein